MKWLGQHRVTGKTKSTGSITTGGPIILQENLSGQLDEHKTVKSTSALTLKGTNGVAGNITLDASNDIYLNADGGDIVFKDNTASLATINSDGLTINNISSGDGSGENFLVEESGVIKKRSAAQTLSDIGASSVSSLNDLSTHCVQCWILLGNKATVPSGGWI